MSTRSSPFEGPGSFARRLLRLLLGERPALTWLLLSAAAETLLGLVAPWLSARAIDTALPEQAPRMLAVIAVLVVLASLHAALAGWVRGKLGVRLRARLQAICSAGVLRRLLETRFADVQSHSFGHTRETLGAARTAALATLEVLVGGATACLGALGATIALAVWFPPLAAVSALACAVMAAGASAYGVRAAALARASLEASAKAQDWLHVMLLSVPTLRAAGATGRAMQHWGHLVNASARVGFDASQTQVRQGLVLQVLPELLVFGAGAWLAWGVMNGSATLGEMTMAGMLIASLTSSVGSLVLGAVGLQALRPHFTRLDELLAAADRTPERSAVGDLSLLRPAKHSVDLQEVWFRYSKDDRWILQGHSCMFPAGEISTLRAASGSGKSTLFRLIAGLLQPEQGSVRVLGLDPFQTSGLVTYLPQQASLLEASIATNLCVLSGKPLEEALRVAEHTGLAELLTQLPMGAETLVSVRGGNFSAGQGQLIAMTAAFATGRPVILLDEATSQLDPASRSRIDWHALAASKTVIHATHE